MTDPIADMLTRIRNAVTAKHTRVDMPSSRIKADIARILQDEGYIQGFKMLDDDPHAPQGQERQRHSHTDAGQRHGGISECDQTRDPLRAAGGVPQGEHCSE